MARADMPVEATDDLAPVTVDVSDDGGDADSGDSGSAEGAEGGQNGQPGEPAAAARAPSGQFQPGQAPRQQRPSKDFRQTVLKGQETLSQRLETLQQTIQQQQQFIQQLTQQREAPSNGNGAGNGAGERHGPIDAQITQLRSEQQQIMDVVRAGGLSAEQANVLSTRYQALEDQRHDLRVQKAIEDRLATLQGGQQPQQDPAVAHASGILRVEFPEVMNSPEATTEARAYHSYLVAQGRADGIGLLREAAAHVARRRGLGSARAPSRQAAAAYSGTPNGALAEDQSSITFDAKMLSQIRGSGVTPAQIARQMLRERGGR